MDISAVRRRLPIVRVSQAVDTLNAVRLGAVLREATVTSPRGFVVDLSCVDAVDCTTMSVLLHAYRSLAANGGRLIVITGQSLAVRAMTTMLMKGLPYLHITQDMDGALVTMLPRQYTVRRRSSSRRTGERLALAA